MRYVPLIISSIPDGPSAVVSVFVRIRHSYGDECFAVVMSVEDKSRKCLTVDQHAANADAAGAAAAAAAATT